MQLRQIRPGGGPNSGEGRPEREGIAEPADRVDPPASRTGNAHITSREIMAAVRERLAEKGFDWSEALRTGQRSPPAGREGGG